MENKELSITMSDGDKKTEFKTNNFNPEHQLAVIDGLFKFFDIHVDFKEMIDVYNKTGKAYQEFYGKKKDVELTEVNEPKEQKVINPILKEQYEAALNEISVEQLTFSNTRQINGVTTYQCHYICPSCRHRANRYIKKFDRTVLCHKCYKTMQVESATHNGNLEQDIFGNYFIAGEFKRRTIM